MNQTHLFPIASKISFQFSRHLGPRISSAGLEIEIMTSDKLEITCDKKFMTVPYSDYFKACTIGFYKGILDVFGDQSHVLGRIHITNMIVHDVDSSNDSFNQCARALIHALKPLVNYE